MRNSWTMKLGSLLLCAAMVTACSSEGDGDAAGTTAASASSAPSSEVAAGIGQAAIDMSLAEVKIEEEDAYTDWSADLQATIRLSGTAASVEGSGVKADAGAIAIQEAGTYAVSGKLDDGQIVVDVPDKGVVRLVLNGAELHSAASAPIYVKEAGKLVVSLPGGTVNRVSDGDNYVFPDATTDEPSAAIFSHDDLTINGSGKLVVEGNYNDGIASKDKLLITGGTLEIKAKDDGIVGKDLAAVQAGDLTIQADGHGIKASNDTEGEEGVINVLGGKLRVESGEDALHSSGSVFVSSGDLTIHAGDDGINADLAIAVTGGKIDITGSNEGIESALIEIAGGEVYVVASDDGVNVSSGTAVEAGGAAPGEGFGRRPTDGATGGAGNGASGGTGSGNPGGAAPDGAMPDRVPGGAASDGFMPGGAAPNGAMSDGSMPGGAAPNGAMSDGAMPGGAAPNGAMPDGSMPNGAVPEGAPAPGGGGNPFPAAASGNKLIISGGYLSVDAQGDGLDANGSIEMSGGNVIVNGPTASDNGPLDYDGTFNMTGGFLVAAGSSGMAQAASDASTQYGVMMTFPQAQQAGTLVSLQDADGQSIVAFAPTKSYQSVYISSPELKKGGSYTLYSGGTSTGSQKDGLYKDGNVQGGTKLVSFEIAAINTWLNESGVTDARSGMMGGPGGQGGGRGRFGQGGGGR